MFVCGSALAAADLRNLMLGQEPGSPAPLPVAPSPLPLVTVNGPVVVEFRLSGAVATVAWASVPGQTYRVQYKNSLVDADWQDLTGDIFAYESMAHIEDPLGEQPQRFYRVVAQP